MFDGDAAWRFHLSDLIVYGRRVAPRDQLTREILHTKNLQLDMRRPVVTSPTRKLNYRFMCAEALWILEGRNEVEPLARFVKRMRTFSDDGETLAGAYGPEILPQLPYVVDTLVGDRSTRQAVLTIWKQNPPPSKDIPCTITMVFSIRDDQLHQHVHMRSSDAWLGVPYDMFSFACVGLTVCALYNTKRHDAAITPGTLTISMTSAHIYERDVEKVIYLLKTPSPEPIEPIANGNIMHVEHWAEVLDDLRVQREHKQGHSVLQPVVWEVIP